MKRTPLTAICVLALLVGGTRTLTARDSAAEITKNSQAALASLYAKVPQAKELGAKAQGILVFPKIVKAGLGIGGQRGEGALLKGGKPAGITGPPAGRSVCRSAGSPTATSCSS